MFVDGAHAFAHFPFTRDELGADYYGTSLHKWLHAPIGTGFLYVRRDKIKSLWPLMAAAVEQDDDIRKYEEIGTHPAANHNAIAVAIAFNRGIGMDRKIARLRYLRDRWAKQLLAASDRVKMITRDRSDEERRDRRLRHRRDGHGQARRMAAVQAQHRHDADGERRVLRACASRRTSTRRSTRWTCSRTASSAPCEPGSPSTGILAGAESVGRST